MLTLRGTSSDGSTDPCPPEGGSTWLPLSVPPLGPLFYSLSPCSSTSPPPLILTPFHLVPNLLPSPIQIGYILTLSHKGLWQRSSITSIVQSPMAIFQFLPWHPPPLLILLNSIPPTLSCARHDGIQRTVTSDPCSWSSRVRLFSEHEFSKFSSMQ